jgi:hypothetical protein
MQQGAENGIPSFFFDIGKVCECISACNFSTARNRTGFEDHGFGKCCFAAPAVAKEHYIPDVFGIPTHFIRSLK